jgi:hypothetical protein
VFSPLGTEYLFKFRARYHAVAPATVIDLDDPSFGGKFNGTTHTNMLGTNNLAFLLTMVRILKEHGKLNLLKGVFFPEAATVLARAGSPSQISTTSRSWS